MSITTPRLLDSALWYAHHGWAVFPCQPGGKAPLTTHGCKDATTDPAIIKEWWQRWPNANVAIATGRGSGIVVLDVDPDHDGDDSLAALLAEHGSLPDTPEVLSGGGGRHLYFKMPAGVEVKNAVAIAGWHGLDFRAEGGYVIAPPSLHPSGTPYTWETSSRPESTPLAEMPPWLVALVAEKPSANGHKPAEALPERIAEGQRNSTLASLAGSMRRRGASEAAILAALLETNAQQCDPPLDDAEVKRIAASVSRYEPAPTEPADEPRRPVVVKLSDVVPERVRWLWPGRIPLGKLTILDGDPGLGKSLLTLDIAARVSTGRPMPDGTVPDLDGPAGVVLLTAEDDPADTIRPRLDAAGADCSRIVLLQAVSETIVVGEKVKTQYRLPNLTDVDAIAEAVRAVEARLVVVDPVMAYMTGDTHKDNETRQVLSRLARLAQEAGVAIPAVRHLNKMGGGNPLYRGGGSIGFIASARAGLLVAPDPDDETGRRRILAATKSNLAELPPALAYHLEPGPSGVVRVVWEGPTSHTATELLAQPSDAEARGALDEAKEFLRSLLADGPTEAKVVKTEAREAAIADITLRRAKAALGVVVKRVGSLGAGGRWEWALPSSQADEPLASDGDAPDASSERAANLRCSSMPKMLTPESMSILGGNEHLKLDCTPANPPEQTDGQGLADDDEADPRCCLCDAPAWALAEGQPYCQKCIPDEASWQPLPEEAADA